MLVLAAGAALTGASPVLAADEYKPGESFRDCPNCPEMVVVPAGIFMMGSPEGKGCARRASAAHGDYRATFRSG